MNFLNKITTKFASKKNIIVIRLNGVIGNIGALKSGLNLEALRDSLEKIEKITKIDEIILQINSPGGSPVQSELIAQKIKQISEDKKVPLTAFIEDVAASGGYWLACVADNVYSAESSIVGSIGVISSGFGFVGLAKNIGVERRVYTQGENKAILDPFLPEKPEDVALIHDLQKEIHANFINHVKKYRGSKLNGDDLFTGKIWCGEIAVEKGLIDGVQNFDDYIANKYQKNAKIHYINKPKISFIKKLLGAKTSVIDVEEAVEAFTGKLVEVLNCNKLGL